MTVYTSLPKSKLARSAWMYFCIKYGYAPMNMRYSKGVWRATVVVGNPVDGACVDNRSCSTAEVKGFLTLKDGFYEKYNKDGSKKSTLQLKLEENQMKVIINGAGPANGGLFASDELL